MLARKDVSRWRALDLLGVAIFIAVVTLLILRLPMSLDLSDESYFAIFIDDWLKGGIRSSTLSTVHETAAFVVYPFALMFKAAMGNSEGMLLFLRVVYLALSIVMTAVWFRLLRILKFGPYAWPIAIAAVAFIPFGLPAPSYNMIAMQGETIFMAAFAIGCSVDGTRRRVWLIAAGTAGAVACVSYPTLTVFVAAFCLLSFAAPGLTRRDHMVFIASVILFLAVGWACALIAFTPKGLMDAFVNLSALNAAGDIWRKISFTASLLYWHKPFTLFLLSAVVLGVVRPRISAPVFAFGILVLTAGCFLLRPTLFLRAHDVMTIWIASGIWLLGGLRPKAGGEERLVAILYAGSLVAGAITAASATWSPFNFCIGGFPAGLLAVAYGLRGRGLAQGLGAYMLAGMMTWLGYAEHFGVDSAGGQVRIDGGFFKGMYAPPHIAELIGFMRQTAAPATEPDKTILVLGRYFGLSLATEARQKAISVFFVAPDVSPKAAEYLGRFYLAHPDQRPRAVVVYKDRVLDPVNSMGDHFSQWYGFVERRELKDADQGVVTLYRRK